MSQLRPSAINEFGLFGRVHVWPAVAVTFGIGVLGGLLAKLVGLPLPWLSGALIAVGAAAIFGVAPGGAPVQFPTDLRLFFVPIVGVAIGGAFTPEILKSALSWWPSFLTLLVFIPVAHLMGFWVYRRLSGLDPVTAFFAATPGGLIEAIAMGEERGADMRWLVLLQFSRLIFCILSVPLVFSVIEGVSVGSASGVEMAGASNPIHLWDVMVLGLAGVFGLLGARRLNLPAALITGPLFLSGLAHLTGLTAATPPQWMIDATQLVVGVGLGARFVGLTRSMIARGLALAAANTGALLLVAAGVGVLLGPFVGQPPAAVLLAFAPGGVVEMSLIAVSLQMSVVFVSAHHVARILIAVISAQYMQNWVIGLRPEPTPTADPSKAEAAQGG